MKLHEEGEFTALSWVKQALDAELALAREALETFVGDPSDLAPMRDCVGRLHQVQGSLRMVELYGAAMVVENMERLAESLLAGTVRQREESYSVLMRGMVQLPDYLERLQSGHRDIPIVLLPLLNDLRACRGENLLTESALFAPDLAVTLPASADGRAQPLIPAELRAQALRMRLAFQAALLKWFRDEGSAEHLNRLMDVLDRLRGISNGADARRLWWVAAAVIEAVENGSLEASVAVKLLFGRVDREIHRFAKEGEAGFAAHPPRELTKNLLYYVAHSGDAGTFPDGARSADVRRAYQLDTLLPSEGEMQHAQGSMAGHNRNLLGTVSAAIKDDLLRVKDALDLFLRSGRSDPSGLEGQVELLDRVGDTLGMLGLGVPRRVVGEQRDIIVEMVQSQREVDEGALLDVAGALLYVEASLDDHIERLGADGGAESDQGVLELPQAEVRRILDALMREAAVNIDQAKHDIVAFIESPWDHERVGQIPRLLEEIAGALRMLGLPDPAELMAAIVRFVEVELISHRRVPTAEQMDKLADALAAIEYYLEASREQRRNRDRILDVARESLDALGYWPLPEAPQDLPPRSAGEPGPSGLDGSDAHMDAVSAAAVADGSDLPGSLTAEVEESTGIEVLPGRDINDLLVGEAETPTPPAQELDGLRLAEAPDGDDGDGWIEIEEEIEEKVPAEALAPVGFDAAASEEIDDDIREVFIEEVEEELSGMRQQLPRWKGSLDDLEQLKPLRRAFHTLKGSGRLVGALALGEFSWKIENLLNRLLDRSVPVTPAVVDLVERAVEAVSTLLAALRGEPAGGVDTAGFAAVADRLAAGEEAWLSDETSAVRTVKRIVRRRVPAPGAALPAVEGQAARASLADEEGVGDPERQAGEIVAGPLPNIDPVLFDILQSEVAGHLATIEDYLSACGSQAVPVSEPLLRAAHTLNGAIAMVDIPAIGHVLAPLESYVKRLRSAGIAPDAGGLAAMREAVRLTREVMRALDAREATLPDSSELTATLTALASGLPESDPRVLWESISGDVDADDDADAAPIDALSGADGAADTDDAGDTAWDIPSTPADDRPVAAADESATEEPAAEEDGWFGSTPVSADDSSLWDSPTAAAEAGAGPDAGEPAADGDHDGWLAPRTGATPSDPAPEASLGTGLPAELMAALEAFEPDVEASGEPTPDAPSGDSEEVSGAPLSLSDDVEERIVRALEPTVPDATDEPPPEQAVEADATPETDPLPSFGTTDAPTGDSPVPEADIFTPAPAAHADAGVEVEPKDAPDAMAGQAPSVEVPMETPWAEAVAPEPAVESRDDASTAPDAGPDAASAARMLDGPMPPPLAEDPQPEGTLGVADIDDDLLEIFVQEGADILDHADTMVARLREAPGERAPIVELQRDLHTLKGGARMAGLAPIGDLSHAMESLVDGLSEGGIRVDRAVVESLERGFDRLHVLVQRVAQRRAIGMPLHAIARFERIVAGEPLVAPSSVDRAEDTIPAAAAPAPVESAVPQPRRLTAMDREEAPHAPQELIRVRSELLDSLVNYAGEVSIYRSRLEQQISTFRFNLVELDQTVTRLREQLRKLEIETEAQIIARYQREQQDTLEGAFDPLELDRFSQLQQLSRALGESVSDLVSIQGLLDDQTRQSETLLLQQSRVSSDLQEGLMRTRMVPFDSLVPNLRRTLRQAAEELGKRAQLKVEGAHGEMDRNLLERMKAPFEHMLRNALAHGIERPEQRLAAGKPEEGTVGIVVSREATEVVLRVTDDGRGMDRDAIRRQAIERGLLKPDVELSDRDLYGFVLETGFSTARELTQLSGRGVGMDVVHNEIKQLGGSLAIDSKPGKGTEFTIRLPFTLAVTQAILVRLGESVYAIPMSSVQGVARIAGDELERRLAAGDIRQVYGGEEYQIHDLAQLLGVPRVRAAVDEDVQVPLLMIRSGDQRAAVRIDSVVGSREIVVKSVGPQVSSVPGIFGATIMGDGAVVIILDLAPLVRRLIALRAHAAETGEEPQLPAVPEPALQQRRKPLVMVVDDSITMRKVTTRVLERADFEVATAKDGLDALEKLQDLNPDLLLLDIEMPRMDGYELAIYMRNDARLKQVPIIMITSRTGEKHRQRALEIGVERYLGKPYQEDELLRHVHETLEVERG